MVVSQTLSATKKIYYNISTGTWVVGPFVQFYEEVVFALCTFSRRSRDLIRATKADIKCSRQCAYIGLDLAEMCPNPGIKKCKVGPSPYTCRPDEADDALDIARRDLEDN